jgi:hypothetical protein
MAGALSESIAQERDPERLSILRDRVIKTMAVRSKRFNS